MTRFKQKLKYISVELLLYQVIYIFFKHPLFLLLEKDIGKICTSTKNYNKVNNKVNKIITVRKIFQSIPILSKRFNNKLHLISVRFTRVIPPTSWHEHILESDASFLW